MFPRIYTSTVFETIEDNGVYFFIFFIVVIYVLLGYFFFSVKEIFSARTIKLPIK